MKGTVIAIALVIVLAAFAVMMQEDEPDKKTKYSTLGNDEKDMRKS